MGRRHEREMKFWLGITAFAFADAFVPLDIPKTLHRTHPGISQRFHPVRTTLGDEPSFEPAPESWENRRNHAALSSPREADRDLGSDIFLNNLEENLVSKQILTEMSDVAAESLSSEAREETTFGADFVNDTARFLTGPPILDASESSSILEEADVKDTVTTILAVSSEAVERAEVTLSKQVRFENDIMNTTDDRSTTRLARINELPDILPAADIVGDKPAEKIPAPSVGKILKFAIPAIGVWLCGPLLSLIDTSSVGILSGTVQQAALNPAVAVTDYAALLIAFLYTGTTNLIAEAREADRGTNSNMPVTSRTFIGALQMSTFVGAGLGMALFLFAKQLLRAIIGNDAISPAVFAAAMKYVKIRALGMPAAAVIGSAQAACLGMQDIRSPLYVLLAAAGVNFMGDMLFVGSSHPWIGGAAGAAWATVFSQYAALGLFVHWLTHKPQDGNKARVLDLSKAILELTGKPSSAGKARRANFVESIRSLRLSKPRKQQASRDLADQKAKQAQKPVERRIEKSFSVRGFLQNRFNGLDLLKPPQKETLENFAPYVAPVTSTQVGRVSGYVAMSHVVSSALGTCSMAAQQIIVSLFYCLCPIADSLSLTAQSFVPAISGKKVSRERARALREISWNFGKAGAIFGSVMVAAVACIPFLSGFFTTDAQVVALVNTVAPLLVGFFGVHGILCACEGLLLGQKDLSFLGRSYAAYFLVVPYFMLRVKRAALAGSHAVNLTSVWKVFLGYQFSRAAAWALRVLMLQRRTENEASRLSP